MQKISLQFIKESTPFLRQQLAKFILHSKEWITSMKNWLSHFLIEKVPEGYRNIKEFLYLLSLLIQVQFKHLVEYLKVIFLYYRNISFLKIDITLLLIYILKNPFSISKRYLLERKEKELYAYGETPLTTLDSIFRECPISEKDTVFELGSGRGRACFWLHTFIGCQVVGIEYVPEFIIHANEVKERFALNRIEFRQEDMLDADLSGATIIYLYGTCLDDGQIKRLIEQFSKLPAGTKIITISYPLIDYTDKPLFEVMKCFQAKFPWGIADIYLHYKK